MNFNSFNYTGLHVSLRESQFFSLLKDFLNTQITAPGGTPFSHSIFLFLSFITQTGGKTHLLELQQA